MRGLAAFCDGAAADTGTESSLPAKNRDKLPVRAGLLLCRSLPAQRAVAGAAKPVTVGTAGAGPPSTGALLGGLRPAGSSPLATGLLAGWSSRGGCSEALLSPASNDEACAALLCAWRLALQAGSCGLPAHGEPGSGAGACGLRGGLLTATSAASARFWSSMRCTSLHQ